VTLAEKQQSLIDDLNLIHDPHERLAAVVSRVAKPSLPEAERADSLLVPGCVSRVWLAGSCEDGRCRFRCDADSPLVRGLVALLCDLYSEAQPGEVTMVEPAVWERCGLARLLSPTRLNGLAAARRRIAELAAGFAG
jgi:cysteine desulfuration protein SufE